MFTTTVFTIARTWKPPRCPSADEWIKKFWHIYTMEYYSAIKRNTFESVLIRWMNLEPIIQSKVSQKEKDKYHILTIINSAAMNNGVHMSFSRSGIAGSYSGFIPRF